MFLVFFFFKQKTAYEIGVRLVGSEMCIRDRTTGVSAKIEPNTNFVRSAGGFSFHTPGAHSGPNLWLSIRQYSFHPHAHFFIPPRSPP